MFCPLQSIVLKKMSSNDYGEKFIGHLICLTHANADKRSFAEFSLSVRLLVSGSCLDYLRGAFINQSKFGVELY